METPFEHILISEYKPDMVSYIQAHPEAFNEAVELAVSDKQPFAWRSAWLLWSCMSENDSRVKKHIKKIISYLPSARDNQKRELLKILLLMEIKHTYCAKLFDFSINLWSDVGKEPSIRLASLKMALKISRKFPELFHEIMALTGERYLSGLSAAVLKSVEKLIRQV